MRFCNFRDASRRFQLTPSREEDGRALAVPALGLHRCAAEWRSASEPLRLVLLPRAERTGLISADTLPIHLATRTTLLLELRTDAETGLP